MNENAEREAFEKWSSGRTFFRDAHIPRSAWEAWQARAALSPPPAQGEATAQASSAHAAALALITEAGKRLSYNVDLAQSLATFSDFWGLDCYTPQTATMNAVRDIVRALLALSQAAPPAAALAQAEGQPAPAPAGVNAVEVVRDINILIAQIRWLEEVLGETLEAEDSAVVAQIEAAYSDLSKQGEG